MALEDLLTPSDLADIGSDLGVGGPDWDVTKPGAGDGVNAVVGVPVAAGEATAYVIRRELSALALALAGGRVEGEQWVVLAPASELAELDEDGVPGDGIWEGRTITSQADASLRFRLTTLDLLPIGVLLGGAEKVR